jgi:hypothetical protein
MPPACLAGREESGGLGAVQMKYVDKAERRRAKAQALVGAPGLVGAGQTPGGNERTVKWWIRRDS